MTKLTKIEARYRVDGTPPRHCGICTMFRAPNRCTAVEGDISPQAVCKLFKRRKRGRNPLVAE